MDPRISSIENLIASDPGGRNIFGLVNANQLRLAAQSLLLARRVAIVSGFYILEADASETDGPPGAKVLGQVLQTLGIDVDYITDPLNAPAFRALGLDPVIDTDGYLDRTTPTHLISVERVGRGADGRYRNMRAVDITEVTAPLDDLFIQAAQRGIVTIGIGDGGNEIGMGNVFADVLDMIRFGETVASIVVTDFCIASGVSNWGAFGLAAAVSILAGRDLLPPAETVADDLERMVRDGGAVDGVTHRRDVTTDGLELSESLRMLGNIRSLIDPSPLRRAESLRIGLLGYGAAGRAVSRLLARHGHRMCISEEGTVSLEADLAGAEVESGGHTLAFLKDCELVVVSPGVAPDHPILAGLHRLGIPVMSELEVAYQIRDQSGVATPLIGVTGTIGKRTTVELLQRLFRSVGKDIVIGGNRGKPLSELLLGEPITHPVALAVSSFQLESVVHFRPTIAILLNIDREHLDRHRSVAEYTRIKSRIFMNHRPDDVLILPRDDDRLRSLARKHQGRTFFISSQQAVDRGAWLLDGSLCMNIGGTVETLGRISPLHAENLLAAVLAARFCGLTAEEIARALEAMQD